MRVHMLSWEQHHAQYAMQALILLPLVLLHPPIVSRVVQVHMQLLGQPRALDVMQAHTLMQALVCVQYAMQALILEQMLHRVYHALPVVGHRLGPPCAHLVLQVCGRP